MTTVSSDTAPAKRDHFKWIAPLVVLAPAIAGIYYSEALMNWNNAGQECLKFATETETAIAMDPEPGKKPFVANQWLKGRYIVVEMGQQPKGKPGYYQSRLCVVGSGQIQIPGGFEQWEWR